MYWYLAVLKKYAVFHGRARRTEYWVFCLFNCIIGFGLGILAAFSDFVLVLASIYFLGVLIPGFAVFVRRLHDTNRSGWWWLIGFIPVIGAVVLFVFTVLDSQPGENRYGPNPKSAGA